MFDFPADYYMAPGKNDRLKGGLMNISRKYREDLKIIFGAALKRVDPELMFIV